MPPKALSFSFNKTDKLAKQDYDRIFSENTKIVDRFFVYLFEDSNIKSKLGIVVTKKNIPKATKRNAVKRLVRESFRINSKSLKKQINLVILSRKSLDHASKQEVFKCLNELWQKLMRC